jgi:hypothetical protein
MEKLILRIEVLRSGTQNLINMSGVLSYSRRNATERHSRFECSCISVGSYPCIT